MERLTWGLSFRLAGIFCAICFGFGRANASLPNEQNLDASTAISVAPLWEQYNPDSKPWTSFAWNLIAQEGDDMIAGARDIEKFCPNYYHLNRNDKITAWLYIVSTIVKYESYFKPTDRYEETGMGLDKITHKTIWSEGLLQLSYQDVLTFPYCNEFDWNKDKHLPASDPKKSILDPYKNLRCGIRILNDQIHQQELITTREGAYWAVIMKGNKHNRLDKIIPLVNGISICQKH